MSIEDDDKEARLIAWKEFSGQTTETTKRDKCKEYLEEMEEIMTGSHTNQHNKTGVHLAQGSYSDAVNPTHYSRFPIQPIDFIIKNKLSYLQGNIIKYVCRFDAKNGVEDLKKAKQYLEWLIEEADKNGR